MEKPRARRITEHMNPALLTKDLAGYCRTAVELGAAAAKTVPAKSVRLDERVRLKCMVPRCHLYGESANCPPHTPPIEEMRKVLSLYTRAIVFKVDVLPKEDFIDDEKWHVNHMKHQKKVHDIVSAIEALAFNDGHYLAAGFAAGGCKTALCAGQYCQALDSGRCRFPLKSRPSMEGVGIDVFNLAARLGWEIYPVAMRGVAPSSIKKTVSIGIVFVA